MFSSIDKALTALVMAVLYLLNSFGGISVDFLSEEAITMLIAGLTPFLVWLVPNKS